MTKSVIKYKLRGLLTATGIYYLIILALQIAGVIIGAITKETDIHIIGDQNFSTSIFIFVVGLCSFKNNFLFSQANGITRRDFWAGSIIALAVAALCVLVIDTIFMLIWNPGLANSFTQMVDVRAKVGNNAILAMLYMMPLYFGIHLIAIMSGFFISLMYYRLNTVGKWVVSLIPVYISIIINLIVSFAPEAALEWFLVNGLNLLLSGLGFLSGDPLRIALPLCGFGLLFALLTYPMLRRAPAFR